MLANFNETQGTYICCLQETHLIGKGKHQANGERIEKGMSSKQI